MKKLAARLLLFLLPMLVIGIGAEYLLRSIPNNYKLKHEYIESKGDRIDGLILGNSHTLLGVNPSLFYNYKVYNLAHFSQTLDLDLALLKNYASKLPNLKFVVIRLSYSSLREQLGGGGEHWRLKNYKIYHKLPIVVPLQFTAEVLSASPNINVYWLNQYYRHHNQITSIDSLGWGHEFQAQSDSTKFIQIGTKTARGHTHNARELVAPNQADLRNLIAFCLNRQVKVILVTTPAHSAYVSKLDSLQLSEVVSTGMGLAKEFENCDYLNLLESAAFTRHDFYDPDHLNPQGAAKLTRQLDSVVNYTLLPSN